MESFYDILQVPRDASPDQIRKAYKKQALLSHPDRLPAGYTPAEKSAAEEKFRKVSNAYEVLKDPENRRLYDANGGVWPPPQVQEQQQQQRSSQPRPPHRYGPPPNRYGHGRFPPDPFADFFTSPFEMFDRMFSDYRRHNTMHRSSSRHRDPFEAMYRIHDMMADLERDMFAFPSPYARSRSIGFDAASPPFGNGNGGGGMHWASESSMLTTRNGVTHRIHKRRDFDGNEYVTRTYPDGREVRTINGVEESSSSRGYLPPPGPPPPPPPAQAQAQAQVQSDRRLLPRMNNHNDRGGHGYVSPPPSYHSSTRSPAHSVHSGRGRDVPVPPRPGPGYNNPNPNRPPTGYHAEPAVIPVQTSPVIPDMKSPRVDRPRRRW